MPWATFWTLSSRNQEGNNRGDNWPGEKCPDPHIWGYLWAEQCRPGVHSSSGLRLSTATDWVRSGQQSADRSQVDRDDRASLLLGGHRANLTRTNPLWWTGRPPAEQTRRFRCRMEMSCRPPVGSAGERWSRWLASDRKATSDGAIKRAINQRAILSSISDACYTDTAVGKYRGIESRAAPNTCFWLFGHIRIVGFIIRPITNRIRIRLVS